MCKHTSFSDEMQWKKTKIFHLLTKEYDICRSKLKKTYLFYYYDDDDPDKNTVLLLDKMMKKKLSDKRILIRLLIER